MITLKELKVHLDRMYSIYSRGIDRFLDYKYLIKPNTKEELWITEHDAFFIDVKLLLGDNSIIAINKLFGGENDEYTFKKLFKILHENSTNPEWENLITVEKIRKCENKLNESKVKATIKNINLWRKKYIAHTDKNPPHPYEIAINPDEIIYLSKICEEIFNAILSSFYDNTTYKTHINKPRNANDILNRLKNYYYSDCHSIK